MWQTIGYRLRGKKRDANTLCYMGSGFWQFSGESMQRVEGQGISLIMVELGQEVLSLVVMASLVSVLLPGHLVANRKGTHNHLAGCHDQNSHVPNPTPTDYRCCLVGHHSGTLPVSVAAQAPVAHVLRLNSSQSTQALTAWETVDGNIETCGPPKVPLRI